MQTTQRYTNPPKPPHRHTTSIYQPHTALHKHTTPIQTLSPLAWLARVYAIIAQKQRHLSKAGPAERAKLLLILDHPLGVRVEAVRPRAAEAVPAWGRERACWRHFATKQPSMQASNQASLNAEKNGVL